MSADPYALNEQPIESDFLVVAAAAVDAGNRSNYVEPGGREEEILGHANCRCDFNAPLYWMERVP